MRQLFIYYRVEAVDEPRARSQVRAFQARLMDDFPGLTASLMVRMDGEGASQRTLMETYARPDRQGGVDDACEAAIGAAAENLALLLRSPRQVEAFMPTPAAPFTLLLKVRYGECDAQQVVFNARYGDYADIAVTEYLRHLFGDYREMLAAGFDTQVVRLATDFRSPARFDDVLAITVRTAAVGNTSFTLTIDMQQQASGRVLATTQSTYVAVSAGDHQKMRVPDRMREALERGGAGIVVDQAGVARASPGA